jgi:hypothetical protein
MEKRTAIALGSGNREWMAVRVSDALFATPLRIPGRRRKAVSKLPAG